VEKGGWRSRSGIANATTADARSLHLYRHLHDHGRQGKLSDFPFATSNSPLRRRLDLGTTPITSLTAFSTKTVTNLIDQESRRARQLGSTYNGNFPEQRRYHA